MQAYYAARATEYDAIYAKPERQPDLRAIEAWLPPWFEGRNVLEIACGTGHWTPWIARTAKHVVALDAAAETLQIAATRVPSAHVRLVVGDAYALPDTLETCNGAFAGFWWSHVPKARQHAFLRGLHARLDAASPVVLLDNLYVEGSSTPISDRDAEGNTFQTRTLRDGSEHQVLKNFPTESELLQTFHGFGERLCVTRWTHYWALSYVTPGL
jgi:SAM-dependent methyltransferase